MKKFISICVPVVSFAAFLWLLSVPATMRGHRERELKPTEFLTIKKLFIDAGLPQDELKDGVYFYTMTDNVHHDGYDRVVTIEHRTYWRKK